MSHERDYSYGPTWDEVKDMERRDQERREQEEYARTPAGISEAQIAAEIAARAASKAKADNRATIVGQIIIGIVAAPVVVVSLAVMPWLGLGILAFMFLISLGKK